VVWGAVYEQLGAWQDRRRFPQIGHSVDIGGRSLNVYCSGEGNPTVVLSSGGSLPGFSWRLIQPAIARVTSACWYDRPGLGWSDSGPDTQSSYSIATDLHRLLQMIGRPPPYVLVGHSIGGFEARAYFRSYPDEVAGMVFVDAAHEDFDARIQVGRAWCVKCPRLALVFLARVLGRVGLFRLLGSDPGPAPPGMTPPDWATLASFQRQYRTVVAGLQQDSRASEAQMRTAGRLDNLPLVVLTGAKTFSSSDPFEAKKLAQAQRTWIELQAELARLSTQGKQVIVEKSGHMIAYEAPEAVIAGVLDVVT